VHWIIRGCQFIHEHNSLYNSPNSFFGRNCRSSQSVISNIDHPKCLDYPKKNQKDLEAVARSRTIKAYLRFSFDEEDSLEDELDNYVMAKLAFLNSS